MVRGGGCSFSTTMCRDGMREGLILISRIKDEGAILQSGAKMGKGVFF